MTNPNPTNPGWPTDWQASRLVGKVVNLQGVPVVGNLILTPAPSVLLSVATNTMVVAGPRIITLDATGSFDVLIPSTDDPQITPVGWTYSVKESWTGGREYSIFAPVGVTQNLVNIVPVVAFNGVGIVKGDTGAQGALGPVGPAGAPGAKGDIGLQGSPGEPGIRGVDGVIGAAWRGSWAASTVYLVNDIVRVNGAQFRCVIAHTSTDVPPQVASPGANWFLVVQDGVNGTSGLDGINGIPGPAGSGVFVALNGALPPAGTAPNQIVTTYFQEQLAAGVAATDVFTLAAHGLAENQPIVLVVAGPAPLVAGVVGTANAGTFYWARDVTANTFKVSASANASTGVAGAAVDITVDGNMRFCQ